MEDYINKISSLEEKASVQVAINLCQENGFKEVVLRLEKPTYGCFIPYNYSPFVSDPEKLSLWAKMKKDDWTLDFFESSCELSNIEKARLWDAAVDEQCQRLTGKIPHCLRQGIHAWVNRIALEYLSYSRRQEALFGISHYFLMNIFTRGDWTESGRLDEKKLTQRLLENEQLTVLQRYRIACVYCLHVYIPQLWKKLTQEEKRSVSGNEKHKLFGESHDLVLLWSQMNRNQEEQVTKNDSWTYHAAQQATCYGNSVALMPCWKELQEDIRQKMVVDMALQSLKQWQDIGKKSYEYGGYKEKLVSNYLPNIQSSGYISCFNLPSYYSELMVFFLSQMDEEQRLTFFKKAFQSGYCNSVLECFLDWPHQDDFLPTINRLWGVIPKDKYRECLLALASKYSGDEEKESRYYDYRSVLSALWEKTPEEYKKDVFCDKKNYSVINEGKVLLSRLLKRSPFQEKDEALFKRVFRDQPQEERRAMMLSKLGENSQEGENMCSLLIQKEKWSFVDWLLEECLLKEEIPNFKKKFIESECGYKLCLDRLEENREGVVKDLIDWSLESDTEKTQFKGRLISGNDCVSACEALLLKGKFAEVERVINFCSSSDERKEQFKVRFAQYACCCLLKDCVWEQLDTILAWSVDAEEKIRALKKDLFSHVRIDTHYTLVFIQERWEEVEHFYQWFGLSPEEIKQLKKDTLFTSEVIEDIYQELCDCTDTLLAPLRWCLADEEMVIDLKKVVEEEFFTEGLTKRKIKERLDHLVRELLDDFRKEKVQDKTSREGVFVKDTGEKRSSVTIEDGSSSPRKRCK